MNGKLFSCLYGAMALTFSVFLTDLVAQQKNETAVRQKAAQKVSQTSMFTKGAWQVVTKKRLTRTKVSTKSFSSFAIQPGERLEDLTRQHYLLLKDSPLLTEENEAALNDSIRELERLSNTVIDSLPTDTAINGGETITLKDLVNIFRALNARIFAALPRSIENIGIVDEIDGKVDFPIVEYAKDVFQIVEDVPGKTDAELKGIQVDAKVRTLEWLALIDQGFDSLNNPDMTLIEDAFVMAYITLRNDLRASKREIISRAIFDGAYPLLTLLSDKTNWIHRSHTIWITSSCVSDYTPGSPIERESYDGPLTVEGVIIAPDLKGDIVESCNSFEELKIAQDSQDSILNKLGMWAANRLNGGALEQLPLGGKKPVDFQKAIMDPVKVGEGCGHFNTARFGGPDFICSSRMTCDALAAGSGALSGRSLRAGLPGGIGSPVTAQWVDRSTIRPNCGGASGVGASLPASPGGCIAAKAAAQNGCLSEVLSDEGPVKVSAIFSGNPPSLNCEINFAGESDPTSGADTDPALHVDKEQAIRESAAERPAPEGSDTYVVVPKPQPLRLGRFGTSGSAPGVVRVPPPSPLMPRGTGRSCDPNGSAPCDPSCIPADAIMMGVKDTCFPTRDETALVTQYANNPDCRPGAMDTCPDERSREGARRLANCVESNFGDPIRAEANCDHINCGEGLTCQNGKCSGSGGGQPTQRIDRGGSNTGGGGFTPGGRPIGPDQGVGTGTSVVVPMGGDGKPPVR